MSATQKPIQLDHPPRECHTTETPAAMLSKDLYSGSLWNSSLAPPNQSTCVPAQISQLQAWLTWFSEPAHVGEKEMLSV